jgi:branched-chain amino acid transport system ATP-binding protein
MSEPRVLLPDEPSLGPSPLLSKQLFKAIAGIRATRVTVLRVEQNARLGRSVADRGYLIVNGQVSGGAARLGGHCLKNPGLKRSRHV